MSIVQQHPIKGIFISKIDGTFLVSVKFDENLNDQLLSAFIGALQMFGKESVGKIEEIIIKGLDIEVLIVTKHNLILTTMFGSNMKKEDLREESEKALDAFYETYGAKLENWDCGLDHFCTFEDFLKNQVNEYFERLRNGTKYNNFWNVILSKIENN